MTAQADFLDVFTGDRIEIQIENEDGDQIRTEEAKVVSANHVEPERIQGIPKTGYKSATLEVENEDGQAEVKWMHMKREVASDGDINYGRYEVEEPEDDFVGGIEKEKIKEGTVTGLEVLN